MGLWYKRITSDLHSEDYTAMCIGPPFYYAPKDLESEVSVL
jgi:hypothetical protein